MLLVPNEGGEIVFTRARDGHYAAWVKIQCFV